jgi:flagellar M-ring protein FliF
MGFEKGDLMHLGETLILAVVAVLMILLVIRPMVNRLLDGTTGGGPRELGRLLGGPGATAALPAPAGAGGRAIQVNEAGEQIDMSQVESRVGQSSMKRVGEIVEKHPEEALAIVRSWMYSDSR